jgi:hypothetical protein
MKLQCSFRGKPEVDPSLNAVLVCSQSVFNEKINLLKYSRVPFILMGRVSVKDEDAGNNIGSINDLKELTKSRDINTAIFCEGLLTYKKIIETVEILPRKVLAMFHAEGSNSIIGSSHKTRNGFVINWKPEVVE